MKISQQNQYYTRLAQKHRRDAAACAAQNFGLARSSLVQSACTLAR